MAPGERDMIAASSGWLSRSVLNNVSGCLLLRVRAMSGLHTATWALQPALSVTIIAGPSGSFLPVGLGLAYP